MQTNPPDAALAALCQAAAPSLSGEESKPIQPLAHAESAQSAIESVAVFSYMPEPPYIGTKADDQAWFSGLSGKGFDDINIILGKHGLTIGLSQYISSFHTSTSLTIAPANARTLAALLLTAADFAEANPNFGKAAA